MNASPVHNYDYEGSGTLESVQKFPGMRISRGFPGGMNGVVVPCAFICKSTDGIPSRKAPRKMKTFLQTGGSSLDVGGPRIVAVAKRSSIFVGRYGRPINALRL
jgi:hypothetical protein